MIRVYSHVNLSMDNIIRFILHSILIKIVVSAGYRRPKSTEYDYIIVGGGTAGSVLASRLTEHSSDTVVVLEAGINDRDYPPVDVPLFLNSLQRTSVDWQFKTEPMKNACKECKNQQAPWPMGKMLGGGSSHNYLNYIRGSKHDYNRWESLGNEGWGYKDILPYFKKSENNRDPERIKTGYHNVGGPLSVEPTAVSELGGLLVQAGEELGYESLDINGPDNIGFDKIQHITKYGRRMNAALSFMWPNRHRENLFVETESHVTKILFENTTAVGVQYMRNEMPHMVYAKKEVILSAGTVNTPQLLMLSGIGPADHLRGHGIDVISDLPVGISLEDHYMTYLSFSINQTLSITKKSLSKSDAYYNYTLGLGGVFSTSGTQAVSFHTTNSQSKEVKFPYLEIFYSAALLGSNDAMVNMLRDNSNAQPQFWDEFYEKENEKEGYETFIAHLHPRNTGTLRLRNTDPFSHPIIKMEYLDHPDDVKDMIEGIRIQMKLIKTKTMQKLGTVYESPHHKGCLEYEFDTDDYWECYIRYKTITGFHQTSTCKMSPGKDGVVDNMLRVKGVKCLRVVDASIMPHVISGNTMAPTIMIAEKAADLIKQDHHPK